MTVMEHASIQEAELNANGNIHYGNFRIIIVGGSVSGLSLANICERLGFDYVVLEAHPKIAPGKGQSVAFHPPGSRILDQLGCFQPLVDLVKYPLQNVTLRQEGKLLQKSCGVGEHILERHSAQNAWFSERRVLLQCLYDKLTMKDQVRMGKRAVQIEMVKDCVQVKTNDGDVFTGDIVIGADGVHSFVREEMERLMKKDSPEKAEASKDKVPCDFVLLYGSSPPTDAYPPGNIDIVSQNRFVTLLMSMPSGGVFYFLFEKLPKTLYDEEIPRRYTTEQAEEVAQRHLDAQITEKVKFRDLWDSSDDAVLLSVPEHVYRDWHFQRIMIIGDAAHKGSPLTAGGVNMAVEDGAVLINELTKKLDSITGKLSLSDIERIFAVTQEIQYPRATARVNQTRALQMVLALPSRKSKLMQRLFASLIPREARVDNSSFSCPAPRIDKLPVPCRRRYVPFNDELPVKPLKDRPYIRRMVAYLFIVLYIASIDRFDWKSSISFPDKWWRIGDWKLEGISLPMTYFKGIIWSLFARTDMDLNLNTVYYLTSLFPAYIISIVEAYRRGNRQGTIWAFIISWPSVWWLFGKFFGLGRSTSLYYIASLYSTKSSIYTHTPGRIVDLSIAKALLPGISLGHLLPTLLIYLPYETIPSAQKAASWWRLYPVMASVMVWILAKLIKKIEGIEDENSIQIYENRDVPFLKQAYLISMLISATVHIGFMLQIISPSGYSTWHIISAQTPFSKFQNGTADIHISSLQHDLLIWTAAVTVWCVYTVYELRRLGYIGSNAAVQATLVILASIPIVGPGAMYAGLWYWRESIISGISEIFYKKL